MHLMTEYFEEHMLIEQPDETPEHLLARYQQQARAWRHRQSVEGNDAAAMFAGDLAHMLEQLTGALAATLAQPTPRAETDDREKVLDRFLALATCPDDASRLARLRQAINYAKSFGLTWPHRRGFDRATPAAPPSIADMAPGTTFSCRLAGSLNEYRLEVPADGDRFVVHGWGQTWVHREDVDPSTIRDVTPPPASPEAGA
jgi:hypothetical protein